jgi:hypothetical protein
MSDFISDVPQKIKEMVEVVHNVTKLKKNRKLEAAYIENDKFSDSNLHEGYFCYNCMYWIPCQGSRSMLVGEESPVATARFQM